MRIVYVYKNPLGEYELFDGKHFYAESCLELFVKAIRNSSEPAFLKISPPGEFAINQYKIKKLYSLSDEEKEEFNFLLEG